MDTMERIHKAFCGMPYGGVAHFVRTTGGTMTLDDVADNLEKLAVVLDSAAKESEANSQELNEIRAEMRAVKSLFARIL